MRLVSGSLLGPYEILSPIGAGGMGEVYRARDTKLGRDVAIKVLPSEVAETPERLARFRREAHLLASLNHPHIASIYGIEEIEERPFLVLELVEGEDLSERLRRGVLPVDEALDVARQVAEALEEAHEKGIVHRDLKPANIKVTPDGEVKVLDFGLAKAYAGDTTDGSASDLSHSPTLAREGTAAGVIMGTAAYMSPEQARGKQVDKRADNWAFGCVLYEMLAGKKLFTGETVSDILAAVLKSDADWESLPASTPTTIRLLLRRCLDRDRKHRLQAMGEARIAIEDYLADPDAASVLPSAPAASSTPRRRALPWAMVGALAVLSGVLWSSLETPRSDTTVRLSITLPPTVRLGSAQQLLVAVSPDAERFVYVASSGKTSQLYVRELDAFEAKPLPQTEGAQNPFFSPDGRSVGFFAEGKLKKVAIEGGVPTELAEAAWGHGTWGPDGTIIYTPNYNTGLWRVSAGGGTPEELTAPEATEDTLGHWWPQALPDAKTVFFTAFTTPAERSRIVALSLETMQQKTVMEGGSFGRYAPTGHLVFTRRNTLMAARFDLARLEATAAPVPVLQDVPLHPSNGHSQFGFSHDGSLVYIPASVLTADREIVWVDRNGAIETVTDVRRPYAEPRLSPDGNRVALTIEGSNRDIWIHELGRGTLTRLTFDPTSDQTPTWTPDGTKLLYRSDRPVFDLFWKPADGSAEEEPLFTSDNDKYPMTVSPDGKVLIFLATPSETRDDIWLLPLEGEKTPQALIRSQFNERNAVLSPNGRWLAYQSDESGRFEVYVQAYPGLGGKWQISTDGGSGPLWARSGRELFYRNGDQMMAVPITTQSGFSAGEPRLLFEGRFEHFERHPGYDVSLDGQRFLMIRTPPESAPRRLNVILNWFEELERLAPTN
ncbi:MAG: protein kinase [Vicinamibacteria bacterium]